MEMLTDYLDAVARGVETRFSTYFDFTNKSWIELDSEGRIKNNQMKSFMLFKIVILDLEIPLQKLNL